MPDIHLFIFSAGFSPLKKTTTKIEQKTETGLKLCHSVMVHHQKNGDRQVSTQPRKHSEIHHLKQFANDIICEGMGTTLKNNLQMI